VNDPVPTPSLTPSRWDSNATPSPVPYPEGDGVAAHPVPAPRPGLTILSQAVTETWTFLIAAAYTQATAGHCPHGVPWTNCHQHQETG
jgi:hypothetical protein